MKIPLEILKIDIGYQILCRLKINNKEFRMLLDTGASQTMFDIKKYKEISDEDKIDNDFVSSGFGGHSIKSSYIKVNEMKLGDIIIKDYNMLLINFDSFNSHFKNNGYPLVDGIIGGDILYKYHAMIDYESRDMILKEL
jgi:hypothetical protein